MLTTVVCITLEILANYYASPQAFKAEVQLWTPNELHNLVLVRSTYSRVNSAEATNLPRIQQ